MLKGPGHSAKNEDHLGKFTEVDKCCRAHDLWYLLYIQYTLGEKYHAEI